MLALIFTRGDLADRHRLERAGEVMDVGRDDEPASRHFVPNQLRAELLALGDESHRVGDFAATRDDASAYVLPCSTPYAGTNRIRF